MTMLAPILLTGVFFSLYIALIAVHVQVRPTQTTGINYYYR